MIFEDCKLFRDVAHARSLSRAAAMNGISQSAATQHIQELEKRLGVQMLDRSTRPLGLTAAGKLYAELCRDVLRREEDFIVALDAIKADVEGTVRVASIYSIGLTEMPRDCAMNSRPRVLVRNCKSNTCGRTRYTKPSSKTKRTSVSSVIPSTAAI